MLKIAYLKFLFLFVILTIPVLAKSDLEDELNSNYKLKKEDIVRLKESFKAANKDFMVNRKELFNTFNPFLKSNKLERTTINEYLDFVMKNDPDFKLYISNTKYTLVSSSGSKSLHDKDIKKRFENTTILELEKYSIHLDKNAKLKISQDLNFQNQGKIPGVPDSKLISIRVGGNLEINELDEQKNWKLVASFNNSEVTAHISEKEAAIKATEKTATKVIQFFLTFLLESYSDNIVVQK